jgi:ATP-dependent Zn protease
MAYNLVARWGMNSKIGNISFPQPREGEILLEKPYSEATAQAIDTEARKLVYDAYERTEKLLNEKKEGMIQVAKLLLEKEVLIREDLESIFGVRPFESKTTFDELAGHPS